MSGYQQKEKQELTQTYFGFLLVWLSGFGFGMLAAAAINKPKMKG